jgi:predicted NUDIX family NTP pyrophosphohydrolase
VPVTSAGLLLHRTGAAGVEVLIAHMGGPFWVKKDAGAWSIPKGEYDPDAESAESAAVREFCEELGVEPPPGPYAELGVYRYSSGKLLTVFAADGSAFGDPEYTYGEFDLEWPPRSGRFQSFPEVDRAEWTLLDPAADRLVKAQRPALDAIRALRS